MISYCRYCGTILRPWKIKCTNCRESAMNWLHLTVIAVVAGTAVVYLIKNF